MAYPRLADAPPRRALATARSPRLVRARAARGGWVALLGAAASALAAIDPGKLPPAAAGPVDFGRDVRPIFEQHCLSCHGPDKQRSGYRVDVREVALRGGEGSAPNIIPGRSAESPLIHFVSGLDPDLRMPSKGEPLTAAEVGILRAWIDQGASWPDDGRTLEEREPWRRHWAFQPLVRPSVPAAGQGWARNPIDAFIAARRDEIGLGPSPEADRPTLLRRLSLDLIGLPPTPEELAAFVADAAPDAYERQVERLLASPHHGERWARHWLDVVRFAESDGFERNNLRPNAWPYRDYVIRAFNSDLPYDRFVREQVAGDATGVDAATGFIVGGSFDILQSFEPPLFNLGQRADELYEMVGTTGTAFLGLTLGCARCHDHKFDPVSQADYYAFVAVFQGVEHGVRPLRPANHAELEAQAAGPRRRLAELDAALAPHEPLAQLRRVAVLAPADASGKAMPYPRGTQRGQAGDPGAVLRLPALAAEFRVVAAGDAVTAPVEPWGNMPVGRFRVWVSWAASPEHARSVSVLLDGREIARVDQACFADGTAATGPEPRWSGPRDAGIHVLPAGARLALRGAGTTTADVLICEEVTEAAQEAPVVTPHLRAPVVVKANEDRFAPQPAKFVRFTVLASNTPEGYLDELEVFTAGAAPRNVALTEFGGRASSPVVDGHDGNPFYVNDGRYNERAAWNSPAGKPGEVVIEFAAVETVDRVRWSRNRSDRAPTLEDHLVTAYRIDLSVDGAAWTTVATSDDRLGQAWRKRVPAIPTLDGVGPAQAAEFGRLAAEREARREELRRLTDFPPVYAGRLREPGPTHRLHRGDPLSRREPVAPGGLSRLGPRLVLPPDLPEQQRRVALGAWLTAPENPLPARVMANRLWHYHFGTGIVDTPSDFGLNGARPTHPELLDWLASEFIARGWSLKALHRLIVTSATYRQASRPHPAGLAADAADRRLWRYPARRVEGEVLRDLILAVSGRLAPEAGGPGFFLFEPNVSRSNIQTYVPKQTFERGDLRRMIYETKPRAQLDDVFGAFDCPDAGQIAPSRTRSTTPLQAFNLLNSPFLLQQAAALAARLEREAGSDPARQVARAFQLALGREPAAEESAAAVALIARRGLPLFCRALFNANEFLQLP